VYFNLVRGLDRRTSEEGNQYREEILSLVTKNGFEVDEKLKNWLYKK